MELKMKEVWKKVPGFEMYKISNLGRIFSFYRHIYLKQKTNKFGYKVVCLYVLNERPKTLFVHRIVAWAFIGNKKNKFINHKNGIKTDNRIENLEWVTGKQNQQHALKVLKISWSRKGARSNWAKLNSNQVLKIRELAEKKINYGIIAKRFGISRPLVTMIKQRKTWAHL